MLLSFIIPYHNEPLAMLHACVGSILASGVGKDDFEIIVIDDGSDQSPADELARYEACTCYRQPNGGPGAARNRGMEMAQGEYIQFVDADDTLLPQYAECISIIKAEHPDILMFHCKPVRHYRRACSGPEFMLHHNVRGAACGLAFRKEILCGLRYDTSLINEDELFNAHLILHADTLIDTGIHAYGYRMRNDSRSHSISPERLKQRLDDAETIIISLSDTCTHLDGMARKALERRVSQLTMDHLYNTAVQTRSLSQLRQRCQRLRTAGLYPLPVRAYTAKYCLFAMLTHMV